MLLFSFVSYFQSHCYKIKDCCTKIHSLALWKLSEYVYVAHNSTLFVEKCFITQSVRKARGERGWHRQLNTELKFLLLVQFNSWEFNYSVVVAEYWNNVAVLARIAAAVASGNTDIFRNKIYKYKICVVILYWNVHSMQLFLHSFSLH